MRCKWQDATIVVPAGVVMSRSTDGEARTWTSPLKFKAHRAIDNLGEPTDDIWHFYWLSRAYTVPQEHVRIEDFETHT